MLESRPFMYPLQLTVFPRDRRPRGSHVGRAPRGYGSAVRGKPGDPTNENPVNLAHAPPYSFELSPYAYKRRMVVVRSPNKTHDGALLDPGVTYVWRDPGSVPPVGAELLKWR